jgi:hypothetical protein
MEATTILSTGEVLGRAADYRAGSGSYEWNHKIYASVVGTEKITHPSSSPTSEDKVKPPKIPDLFFEVFLSPQPPIPLGRRNTSDFVIFLRIVPKYSNIFSSP